MDCSLPGSSVHGIFQARIVERIAISYSRGSAQPRDWIQVSRVSCITRWILYQLHHLRSPGMPWEKVIWILDEPEGYLTRVQVPSHFKGGRKSHVKKRMWRYNWDRLRIKIGKGLEWNENRAVAAWKSDYPERGHFSITHVPEGLAK